MFIYKIVTDDVVTGKFKVYIGSTSNKLNKRISQHLRAYRLYSNNKSDKYITSFEIIKHNWFEFEVLETVNDINDLTSRERYYINKFKNDEEYICVNKRIEKRTPQEYHLDNWDEINRKKNIWFRCDECDGCFTHTNKSHHIKTKKHNLNINF